VSRALIAGIVLVIALVSGGMLIQSGAANGAAAAPATPRLLDEVMARLRHDFIDTLSTDMMLRMTAAGVVKEVDERYSALLSPDRVSRLRENATGRYAGIGIEVDMRDGFVTVIAPIAGTPADSAGIKAGDRILSIDRKATYGLTMEEVEQVLRGPAGSKVELHIERGDDGHNYTLTRRAIVYHPVRRAALLGRGIAYVELATFSEDAAEELGRAVDSLRALAGSAGSTSLVLDLRDNPGGLLEQGIDVAKLFLDQGQTVASTRGRVPDANRDFVDDTRQRWPGMPIVVLVDSGTASASEIVAGALQDHDRAVLVGTPTYGKGSAQNVFPVSGGYALKLTTAKWFTPDGRSIERDSTSGGIEPDVVVRDVGGEQEQRADSLRARTPPVPPVSDATLARAIQLLQGVQTPAALRSRTPRPSARRP
jgi:carboxyl-terminal processing protease